MSSFETKPTVLARILDGISQSISIQLENAIEATVRHAERLWAQPMQPQYLPVRIRDDTRWRATSHCRDRPPVR
jgi:hypothetical protein